MISKLILFIFIFLYRLINLVCRQEKGLMGGPDYLIIGLRWQRYGLFLNVVSPTPWKIFEWRKWVNGLIISLLTLLTHGRGVEKFY